MKYWILLICGLTFFQTNKMQAQDFSDHQWEDRLLLIKIQESDNSIYKNQIQELKENLAGLVERNIVVYQIKNGAYKKGLLQDDNWTATDQRNTKKYFKAVHADFEIVLVGLDGSVKLRSTDLLEIKQLFSKIDAMPMRRQEMRNANG